MLGFMDRSPPQYFGDFLSNVAYGFIRTRRNGFIR